HPRPTTGSQRRPTAVLMWNGLSSGRLVLVASGLFGVSGFDPMTGPCGAPSTPPRRLKGARPRCHPQGITCVGCYCR
ncbi:aminotransferase, partial [Mycobacterium tuberculosis]